MFVGWGKDGLIVSDIRINDKIKAERHLWPSMGARLVLGPCWGGGGGTPLYKPYKYVPTQRIWFLSRFGLKMGIDVDHYGHGSL